MKTNHTGQFANAAQRLQGELQEREEDGKHALPYNDALLDDQLKALGPHDLVLLGAATGLGKTEKALDIAVTNAMRGVPVHYFALEAEAREIERRTKYALLSQLVHDARHPDAKQLNYADWRFSRCEHIVGDFNAQVDRYLTQKLVSFHTYYRGQQFDTRELHRQVLDVAPDTQLFVLDHLHYIDTDDEAGERALGDLVKSIRDVTLRVGKPCILVAHLRKRDQRSTRLLPTLDDFHGSSNITKICTHVVTIERCHVVDATHWYQSPTFVAVLKDRRGGAPPIAGVVNFDVRRKKYEASYTLGRITKQGSEWGPFNDETKPIWARRHVSPVVPAMTIQPHTPAPTGPAQGNLHV